MISTQILVDEVRSRARRFELHCTRMRFPTDAVVAVALATAIPLILTWIR